ncbi:hypothetical protein [Amycolatopsis methanolica]|uniref:hypothetical protein n=1 Tax=Amycolatopsis methanolica TaxID=1814 RepID=UPI00036FFBE3|nr:hypothetical protein [Amycolatopsis methanolica]
MPFFATRFSDRGNQFSAVLSSLAVFAVGSSRGRWAGCCSAGSPTAPGGGPR